MKDETDKMNCYIEIKAGSGGTESQDWVDILSRVYVKWARSTQMQANIVDEMKGDTAGLK